MKGCTRTIINEVAKANNIFMICLCGSILRAFKCRSQIARLMLIAFLCSSTINILIGTQAISRYRCDTTPDIEIKQNRNIKTTSPHYQKT